MVERWAAILVGVAAASVHGQPGVFGGRAPSLTGIESRAGLRLDRADPQWGQAPVRGTAGEPLIVPPSAPGSPVQLGVNARPPEGPIGVDQGVVTVEDGELVWRVRVDAPGVEALRLGISGLDLSQGSILLVAGQVGEGYVIRGRGALRNGSEWTPILEGGHAYVEWRGPISGELPQLRIDEVSAMVLPRRPSGGLTDLLPCQVDVQCESVDAIARDSVGWMVYTIPQGTFACTGALLNDADANTTLGWFLTSNQCINTAAAAASVTVYWFYHTPSCNGQPPNIGTLPTSQGATIAYHSPAADASLLLLAQDPNQGQGLAGWSGVEPIGTLTTIHHPVGSFKHIARGAATTSEPVCVGSRGHYQFHSLDYSLGITETGSVGAPLFNASWQVVGQCAGVCALEAPTCDNPSQWNAVFGKFSRTLPQVGGFLTGGTSPSRVYVDAAAMGAGTGASWADAYVDLNMALLSACPPPGGMEVWVATGTYRPGPPGGSRESAFALVSGVRVYGGFAGTETLLSQRNIAANPTILSGDLNSDDGPAFANRADNAYHVVRGTGVDSTAVLDGFTIRGGSAWGLQRYNDKGGGLYAEAGSARVVRCRFEDNQGAYSGGGASFFNFSAADVDQCVFTGNRGRFGGGIALASAGGTVVSSIFTGNSCDDDGAGIDAYDSTTSVNGCQFTGNAAGDRGGGASLFASALTTFNDCRFVTNTAGYGGGAVHGLTATVVLNRCIILDNEAAFFGGGVLHQGGASTSALNCRFLGNTGMREGAGIHANSGSLSLTNCEIAGNSTPDAGGGVWHNKSCQTTMINCTVNGNHSGTLAGGVGFEDGSAALTNCVLWGNTDPSGSGETAQIRTLGSSTSVNYSLIKGLTGALGGTGNIGSDPLFINASGPDTIIGTEDDDYAPGPGSPARDSGNNGPVQTLVDLRGNPRRQDDPCVGDGGAGSAPMVDRGAIEGVPCACYANCDNSSGVPALTSNDFQCFLNRFAAGDSYANCDGSTGTPSLTSNDFQCFLNSFAAGCN